MVILENFNDRATTYAGQRAALADELNSAGLGAYADHLMALARPAALLVATPMPDDQIAVGRSKIGGRPDLPASVDWPTADEVVFRSWNDFEVRGTYLIPFLLQINLNELSGCELDVQLPRHGLLSVFHGADEHEVYGDRYEGVRPCWRVLYTADAPLTRRTTTLAPSSVPWNRELQGAPFPAQRLAPQPITTLPELFDAFPLDSGLLAEEDVNAMIEVRLTEHLPNVVRVGGWAYSRGNGEPLGSLREPRKLHQLGADEYVDLDARRAQGWQHLLSMQSRDHWDEFPDQGVLHTDYTPPSFGGDGVMSVYIAPRDDGGWLDPDVLANAVGPICR